MSIVSLILGSWWLVSIATVASLIVGGLIAIPLWRREKQATTEKAEALKNKALEEDFWQRRL